MSKLYITNATGATIKTNSSVGNPTLHDLSNGSGTAYMDLPNNQEIQVQVNHNKGMLEVGIFSQDGSGSTLYISNATGETIKTNQAINNPTVSDLANNSGTALMPIPAGVDVQIQVNDNSGVFTVAAFSQS